MAFELRPLSMDDGWDEYTMLQEIGETEFGFTNEVHGMSYDEYRSWLRQEDDISKSKNLPDNWVPQTTYFFRMDGKPVGIARIRQHSSDYLENQGVGGFGYGIAKPYRGKGYGNLLFQAVLKQCKGFGYSKVKSFVHIGNIPSNRIFLMHGSELVGVFKGTKNIYETTV